MLLLFLTKGGEVQTTPAVREETSRSALPAAIKVVALWQLVKSAGLALIFWGIWPFRQPAPVSTLPDEAALSGNAALILQVLVILYPAIVGLGIWNLQRWARWLLLPLFALTAPWWAMQWLPDASYFDLLRGLLPRSMVPVVATFDVLSVLALLLPDVRRAFGDRDEDIEDTNSPWS
jgi:hypothetical protein